MPSKKKKSTDWLSLIAVVGVPLGSALMGSVFNGFMIANKLATKAQVEDSYNRTIKYTDEKIFQTLKDAYEHSDRNRSEMLSQTKEWMAELRTSNVVLSTKLDALTEAISDLRAAHAQDPRSGHQRR